MSSVRKVQSLKYYHGTYLKDALSIKKSGYSLGSRAGRGSSLGAGFYMSADYNWAYDYAYDIVDMENKEAAILTIKVVGLDSFFDITQPSTWPEELSGKYNKQPYNLYWLAKDIKELGYEGAGNPFGTIVIYNLKKVKVIGLETISL